jgi:uncharacterized protein YlzI (FlbEa/FlbD family)
MAEVEINAVITLIDDKAMHVQDTVGQIDGAIREATNPRIPLIKVTDPRGHEVWINADHIRSVEAYDPTEPLVHWD